VPVFYPRKSALFSIKNCGLMLEPQEGMKVQEIVDWALYAEKKGYGYIFRSDHLLGLEADKQGKGKKAVDSSECWVTLGAIAAKTTKIKFGPMVSPIGFRNPAMLARMACTLDSYSRGRTCLGLGAGWYEYEYKAHGYDFPPFKVRRKQVEEGYRIVRGMTEGERVDFDGEYYSAHVECCPKPAKGKVHLIGGGRNPRIVQTLANYVDEWNVFNSPLETFQKLKRTLIENRSSGQTIEISQMGSFLIAESRNKLNQKLKKFAIKRGLSSDSDQAARKLREEGRLCGVVDEFVDQMNEKIDAGIQKFYFQILDPRDKDMVETLTHTVKTKF
jgi:alkanesulfonate monooxygenase SsuD/methylene tetrahydromethanopterin reductase-like flavin-dependent oxidoreductase (luciferase family)